MHIFANRSSARHIVWKKQQKLGDGCLRWGAAVKTLMGLAELKGQWRICTVGRVFLSCQVVRCRGDRWFCFRVCNLFWVSDFCCCFFFFLQCYMTVRFHVAWLSDFLRAEMETWLQAPSSTEPSGLHPLLIMVTSVSDSSRSAWRWCFQSESCTQHELPNILSMNLLGKFA